MVRRLTLADYLFFALDRAKQPMHLAGVCFFELPTDAPDDFVKHLLKDIDDARLPNFPFDQKRHQWIFWQNIEEFNPQEHCHYHRLHTGDDLELMTLISSLHGEKLNKNNPLWSLHLIDNLNPNPQNQARRFVLYLKMHHALVDGVAALRLFQRSLSSSPDDKNDLPPWAKIVKKRKASFAKHRLPLGQLLKSQWQGITPVARQLVQDVKDYWHKDTRFISSLTTPKSILNQRISEQRFFGLYTAQKQRFVQIAQRFGVSTNDAILAVCGDALRRYLTEQGHLPSQSLIAFVPISLRTNDTSFGNQISFVPANLGTHHQDAQTRLQQVHQGMEYNKNKLAQFGFGESLGYLAVNYLWAGINLASGIYPQKQAFNLVISNVPGDDEPLYLNGAKLTAMYPASVLFDGQALNISFCNYQNTLDFGIIACPVALPNIETLPTHLEQALVHYEQLS